MSKILLVDDIPEFVETEEQLLRECGEGYEVSVAANPEFALERLGSEPFDLVILDLMMPKKNGFELLREIKRRFQMPVMIYSAYLDHISAKVLAREGADVVLSKPAQLDVFLACIQNLLEPDKDSTVLSVHGYKLREIRSQVLTTLILKALRKCHGRAGDTAAALGLSGECLKSLIRKLRLAVDFSDETTSRKTA